MLISTLVNRSKTADILLLLFIYMNIYIIYIKN